MKRVRDKFLVWGVGVTALMLALAAVSVGAVTPAQPPVVSTSPFRFTSTLGITPTMLSKTKPTPVAVQLNAKVEMLNGTHAPALRELAVELDKTISIDLGGYPICRPPVIQTEPAESMAELCPRAMIGNGGMTTEIQLNDTPPISTRSRVQIFNGDRRKGARIFYLATRVDIPTPQWIVATAQLKKIDDRHHGTKALIAFPKIAGGSGSITSLTLNIKKRLSFEGKSLNPVTARCPNGRLAIGVAATFLEASTGETFKTSSELPRTCVGR